MMGNYYGGGYGHMSEWGNWGSPFGMGLFGLILAPVMLLLVAWTLYWKFHALWYAAKHDEKWWFIALLLINSLGILEIAYLYYFSKKVPGHDEKKVPMIPPQQ